MKLYAKSKNPDCSLCIYEVVKGKYALMTIQSDGYIVVHDCRFKKEVAQFIKHLIEQYNKGVIDDNKLCEMAFGFIGYDIV